MTQALMLVSSCDGCGVTFDPPRHKRARNRKMYCSVNCQVKRGDRKPAKPYSKIAYSKTHTCAECVVPYEAASLHSKYCSTTCRRQAAYARKEAASADKAKDGMYNASRARLKHVLLKTQTVCALCETDLLALSPRNVHVDHSHTSGKIRGLLCSNCNLGLGHFKDSIPALERAIAYLRATDTETQEDLCASRS